MRKQTYIPLGRPEARTREQVAIRRPITRAEVAPLEAFGAALRIARKSANLTQRELAWRAGFEDKLVYSLEAALRRPRLSSIEALCAAIVERVPSLVPTERLRDELVTLAGPGLDPESVYRSRVEARRAVRWANRTSAPDEPSTCSSR